MDDTLARPLLRKLATRLGIIDAYLDQSGGEMRETSDETRVRLLAAMGHDACTEEATRDILKALRRARRRQWISPVRVVRQQSRSLERVMVRVPRMDSDDVQWRLVLVTEEGIRTEWSGATHGGPSRRMELTLPVIPPLGYHSLGVMFTAGGRHARATQRLIVVPSRCTPPEARLHGRRGFGITTNLYTVRSEKNWGAGDIGDAKAMGHFEAVVFTGMEDVFASGADLREIAEIRSERVREFALRGQNLMGMIAALPLTTIAAVIQPVPERADFARRGRKLATGEVLDPDELAEWLVARGLARTKGVNSALPGGMKSKAYVEKLKAIEAEAREKRAGIWAGSIEKKSGEESPK